MTQRFVSLFALLCCISFTFCNPDTSTRHIKIPFGDEDAHSTQQSEQSIATVRDRFPSPLNYTRKALPENSFQNWLRIFPLKPLDTPVYLYDHTLKNRQDVHAAVLNIDAGTTDLQQCADAVMRLRAEYLFQKKAYDSISFTFTNGTKAPYAKWREGFRPKITGNNVVWSRATKADTSYASFRKYMNTIFMYCGTASLSKELSSVPIQSIQPGDVFIHGGFPGHAMMVMDVAVHKTSGKKVFLLAQSYMPAQDIHIVKNFKDDELSPWFEIPDGDEITTPEWVFGKGELKRF